ncbi:hypothetical protein J6590_011007 [Homalodisca vitripennis]|nr:hypothetical protein J6590_011007 [Homalodisca vitripennis]
MLTRANKTIADIDPKLISPGLAGLVKKSLFEKCTEEPERDLEPPEPECEGIEESPETIV